MKTYAIRWKSTVNGRLGTGSLRFEKEEAERRAAELNEEHPEIAHEAVIAAQSPDAQPTSPQGPKG